MYILSCDIKKNNIKCELIECIERILKIQSRGYLYDVDKIRHLMGIILAEYGWYLSTGNMPIDIVEDKGKPFFIGLNEEHNIQFNISHSGEIVLCAIGETNLGIDVEKKGDSHEEIIKHYFSDDEKNICNINKDNFYKIWTRKESYLKALEKGISEFNNTPSMVKNGEFVDAIGKYKFYEFGICPEYEIVLCSMGNKDKITILEVDEICVKKFLEMIKEK